MSEKELLVRVLAITVLSFVLLKTNGSESPAVRTVRRRHVGDVYSDVDNRRICQDANNLTYLVDEEQCVRNEELLSYRG